MEAQIFVGKKKPNLGLYLVCLMPIVIVFMTTKSSTELLYSLPIGLALAGFLYYFSPKHLPKKSIRISENSLAMYEDGAINWHIPLAKVKKADIQVRALHFAAPPAYMLCVFEEADQQMIDQDVSFLSVDQHKGLLASLNALNR